MLDSIKDGKNFGMTGSGNNMLMEVILPNSYYVMNTQNNRDLKGLKFKYEVAPDGVNFENEKTVTANVTDDLYPSKKNIDTNLETIKVRHIDEAGKDLITPREVNVYKNLPPNVFHYMLPLVDNHGKYKNGFLGYKVSDTDELVKGEEKGFGHTIHYYYGKNVSDLINKNKEIILVYKGKTLENPNSTKKTDIQKNNNATITSNTYRHVDNTSKDVSVERLYGRGRIQTSLEISKNKFNSADTVILVNGYKEVDALSVSPLASKLNAPILLIEKNNIGQDVSAEIKRLMAKKLIIIGGESSISKDVEKQTNLATDRIAGKNRYETAAKIAEKSGLTDKIILTNGKIFVDALTASSLANKESRSIILVEKNTLPTESKQLLEKANDLIIVGGENSISKNLEKSLKNKNITRIAGKNRYETAVKIAEKSYPDSKQLAIANGLTLVDSLSFGPVTGKIQTPILLTKNKNLPKETKEYLEKTKASKIFILGGENSISKSVFDK